MDPMYLNTAQAAKRLGTTPDLLRRDAEQGKIKGARARKPRTPKGKRRWTFKADELDYHEDAFEPLEPRTEPAPMAAAPARVPSRVPSRIPPTTRRRTGASAKERAAEMRRKAGL